MARLAEVLIRVWVFVALAAMIWLQVWWVL